MFDLERIKHRYGAVTALRIEAWHAGAGEHWLLAGPSGSGKQRWLALAHALAAGVGMWLPAAAPLAAGAWAWQPEEWGVVALALGAGIIATVLPAWRAYRLDVAATLPAWASPAASRCSRTIRPACSVG